MAGDEQKKNRIDETRMMNCGMKATIIAYRAYKDIDIQFEDGTIVEHRMYTNFSKGEIANPNIPTCAGEFRMQNCGMVATVITYRDYNDIDIRFEDNTILKNKSYYEFINGRIRNPKILKDEKEKHIGETRMMNCGMEATIIAYRNNRDIDVQFEDNFISEHKMYIAFTKGSIANPNCSGSKKRTGETKMMNCGMRATITEYFGALNITVEFEDETEVKNKCYSDFQKKSISHPGLGPQRKDNFHGFETKYAWDEDGNVFYSCRCTNCGLKEIMTPQEMMAHKCE